MAADAAPADGGGADLSAPSNFDLGGAQALDLGAVADLAPLPAPADLGRPPPSPACLALRDGWNRGFLVDGTPRDFLLHLPAGAAPAGGWPIVFAWHGRLETAIDIDPLLAPRVNGPDYRFILVTPEDLGLPLPLGADWDNLQVLNGSREARLFDEVIDCLDRRFGLDPDRVHSVGFSSGGIVTDLLGVLRGDRLASLFTFSGAYFSNPANANPLAAWPPLTTPNRYVQFLTWGGVNDSSTGFNFALFALNDGPYLQANHHDTILCDHGGGHVLGNNPSGLDVARFFAAHPRGTTRSPYANGLPPGLPLLCVYGAGAP